MSGGVHSCEMAFRLAAMGSDGYWKKAKVGIVGDKAWTHTWHYLQGWCEGGSSSEAVVSWQ